MTATKSVGARARTVLGCFAHAPTSAEHDVSRYRAYVLETSLDAVLEDSGLPATDVRTVHERPATIHELEWRAPFLTSERELADPVHDITFAFYNRALYQILVTYSRDRTADLTSNDIIEALTVAYGPPVPPSAISAPPAGLQESVVVAQWADDSSSAMLLRRATYASEFTLMLLSKALAGRAHDAIGEAIRLDAIEAPCRELEQRKKQVAADDAAHEKTRAINKAAFRP